MKTASIVIGGAITDLKRVASDRLQMVLDAKIKDGKTSVPYVVAEVVAVHTNRCASMNKRRRAQGFRCICGADDMLARLLGDSVTGPAQKEKP